MELPMTNQVNESDILYDSYNTTGYGPRLEMAMWGWWIKQVLTPIIVVVGLAGNTMSFVVMKSKALRKKSYSHYLCALAVFDSMTLIGREVFLADEIKNYLQLPSIFLDFNDGACKLYNFLEHVCYLMSSWLIVVMAFERIVAVLFPFKKQAYCNQTVAITLVFTLVVVISYTQVFRLIMVGKYDGICQASIQYHLTYVKLHTYFYQICLIFLLPVLLVLICNGLILYKIRKIRKATEDENSTTTRHTRFYTRQHKTTFMLLTISFTYVFCMLPLIVITITVLVVINKYGVEAREFLMAAKPYGDVFEVVWEANYAANFFIYVLSGKSFRRELGKMFYRERSQSFSSVRTRDSQVR